MQARPGRPTAAWRSAANDYTIAAPGANARVLPWSPDNRAIGRLGSVLFVAGDTIICRFSPSEHMIRLAPDRYRACGLFLRSGAMVSAYSVDLARQASGDVWQCGFDD
jgi:hypothetical protein